jgi:hypothetical protein
MNVIVEMKFGSHLYGTDTPESDHDFKGVFLPEAESLILGPAFKGSYAKSINTNTNASDGKNTSQDVDREFYSLHYFLKLALEGQTVALDMLHAPQSAILKSSHLWDVLVEQRSRFYTKNLKTFIGYARRQAAKYGIKGSRLAEVRMVARFLEKTMHRTKWNEDLKLRDVWDWLPKGEHIYFHSGASDKQDSMSLKMYEVVGKKFQETARISYVLPILLRFITEYGLRAQKAEQNEGVDWKALSHALRAAYQIKELFLDGTMTLPLPQAGLILAVKQGRIGFKSVQAELEQTMSEVEELALRSELPEKADHKFVRHLLLYAYDLLPDGSKINSLHEAKLLREGF